MNGCSTVSYASWDHPATDLSSLLEYLATEDKGQYLYRGQTRLWPGPLVPSAYRRYQKTGKVYCPESPEYQRAWRKVATSFVGLVPINFFHETLSLFYPGHVAISREEMFLLEKLSNDQYLARALVEDPEAFDQVLTDRELNLFRSRFKLWRDVINYDHRVQIRDMVCMRPFGYLLGQGLAQQYGFSSETLDVTSDLLVAAFFATHDGPTFSRPLQNGIGVIYRFPHTRVFSTVDLGAYNFHSCPPVLDLKELFARFITRCEPPEDFREEVENFLVTSVRERKTWRCWEEFRISADLLAATRIGRQSAALLVPDLIYEEREMNTTKLRELMAVEDCATREGTRMFCFRHGRDTSMLGHITREYLWPNEQDAFFEMIGNVLVLSVSLEIGLILPSRIDLLDPGYSMSEPDRELPTELSS